MGIVLTTLWRKSLWASLKKELVYRSEFNTREEARTAIFEGI
ncbi:IS3 family transposase [Ferrithrix thermotolerans]